MQAPIDLDALAVASSRPVMLFGRVIEVRPITGTVLYRVLAATSLNDPAAQFEALLSAVPVIAPGLTAEERERLTHEQVLALIRISQGDVDAVEASLAKPRPEDDAGR